MLILYSFRSFHLKQAKDAVFSILLAICSYKDLGFIYRLIYDVSGIFLRKQGTATICSS